MRHRYICIAAALLVFGVTEVWSSGVQTNVTSRVILSNAKNPANVHCEILHCVQNDKNSQLSTLNSDTTSILSTLHSETLQASKEASPQSLQECL